MNHTQTHKLLEMYCDGLDAAIDGRGWGAEHDAARQEIMRRCNAHAALVAALETAEGFRYSSPDTWYPAVQAALKLAKGE